MFDHILSQCSKMVDCSEEGHTNTEIDCARYSSERALGAKIRKRGCHMSTYFEKTKENEGMEYNVTYVLCTKFGNAGQKLPRASTQTKESNIETLSKLDNNPRHVQLTRNNTRQFPRSFHPNDQTAKCSASSNSSSHLPLHHFPISLLPSLHTYQLTTNI